MGKHLITLAIGLLFLWGNLDAQTYFPADMQDKMQQMGISFLEPVDTKYSVVPPLRENDLFAADAWIKNGNQDIWVQLIPEGDGSEKDLLPHLEFQRLMIHLAKNEGESLIYYYDIPPDEGVDWMSEARFTPKDTLSLKPYGTANIAYKEGVGTLIVLYFDTELQTRFEPYFTFSSRL